MASDGRAEFDPKEIARAAFPTAFRGYDQEAVHRYLTRLAAAIGRAQQTGQLGSVDNHDNAAHLRAAEAEHEAAELRSRVEELEELVQAQAYEAEQRVEVEEAVDALEEDDLEVEAAPEAEARSLDESELIEQLGQETARIVEAARSAANDIAQRAEEEASLVKAEATLEARSSKAASEEALAAAQAEAEEITGQASAEAKKMEARVRADAKRSREHAKSKADKIVADAAGRAESDLAAARQRANQIVVDAEQLREEILGDLVRRRRVNQEQLDRLTAARDRLAQALGAARNELDDVASEIHLAIPNSILDLTQDEEPTRLASDGNEVAELVSQLANGSTVALHTGPGDGAQTKTSGALARSNGNGATSGNGGSNGKQGGSGRSNGSGSNGNGHRNGLAEGLSDYRADVSPFEDGFNLDDGASLDGEADADGATNFDDTMQLSVIELDHQDPDQTLDLGNSPGFDLDPSVDGDADADSAVDETASVESDAVESVSVDVDGVSDEDVVDAIVIIDDNPGDDDDKAGESDIIDAELVDVDDADDEATSIDDLAADGSEFEPEDSADAIDLDDGEQAPAGFDGPIDGDRLLEQLGFGVDPVLGSGSGSMQRSATRGDLPRNTPFAGRLPEAFEGRDVALTRSTSGFRRRLKRAVNDDQSDVLDRLRAGRGTIEPDELPPLQDQLDGYVAALRPALNDVVNAGGELLGSSDVPVPALDNLCLQLAKHIVDNLRLPTVMVIEDSVDGDREAILDPVRAIYRDFRNTLLPDLIEDALHEAFALGLYYAIDADSPVVWAIDPRLDPDPICEENSASPALAKGTDFPSGHARPLSMPGCRCLAVPAS